MPGLTTPLGIIRRYPWGADPPPIARPPSPALADRKTHRGDFRLRCKSY
ncbi:MAG TPA: hypothetical protein V6D02_08925 [Candidatus Obscuribacterales bacterium]